MSKVPLVIMPYFEVRTVDLTGVHDGPSR
jgi:hypothetical protein